MLQSSACTPGAASEFEQHGVSAAKDDNGNPDLLNQVVQFTKPNELFTKCYGLLLLSACLPPIYMLRSSAALLALPGQKQRILTDWGKRNGPALLGRSQLANGSTRKVPLSKKHDNCSSADPICPFSNSLMFNVFEAV